MQASDLRVALFSGNYNYVKDGANQALNLVMGYAMRQGVKVRIYSPTTNTPAFEPTGDLVSAPSIAIPFRPEYKVATGINTAMMRDLEAFNPNVLHISAPERLGHGALTYGEKHGIATVGSVHTRFETYPRYYGIGFLEKPLIRRLTKFYNRHDMLMTTGRGMTELLESWGVTRPMGIWSRGVDHDRFNPNRRSLEWRRSLGIANDEVVVGFLGRLVLEKGLGVFADVIRRLQARGIRHRVMVVGKGPARDWFAERVPTAVFAGFQMGDELGRAVASMDIFFNPSTTESFGNVTLEAMAAGVAVVAARSVGPIGLVDEDVTGILCDPENMDAYADAIARFATDDAYRHAAGAAGHKLADGYVWDTINQAMIDAYLTTAMAKGK